MKKNIRFWEQETKSESGFLYTFGVAIAHSMWGRIAIRPHMELNPINHLEKPRVYFL